MSSSPLSSPRHKPALAVLTPSLRRLLGLVLILFGLLTVNSCYLVTVTLAGQLNGQSYENYFYLLMFLAHLGLGLLLILPALLFGALHLRRAWRRPNRYAVRAGIALYITAMVLFVTGVLLTRFGFFEVNNPQTRTIAYWIHALSPLALVWLFVLHRLAGPRLHWARICGPTKQRPSSVSPLVQIEANPGLSE